MRRSLAALAALSIAAPPLATAQTAPASPPVTGGVLQVEPDQIESRLLTCGTQAIFSAGGPSAEDTTFAWNCSGVAIIPLEGVQRSAMLTRGTIAQATRTLQAVVISADGQSACYATRHFLPPRENGQTGSSITPYLTSYAFVTQRQLLDGAGSFVPDFVADPTQLPGDGARCGELLAQPLNTLTTAILTPPRRRAPTRDAVAPLDNSI